MPNVLATCNEALLLQDGDNLVLARRRELSVTFVFVLGLAAALTGFNALFQLLMAATRSGSWPLALGLAGLSAVLVVALVAVLRARRRAKGQGPHYELVLDRARGVLLDGAGQVLAPLGGVSFQRQWQVGSSSRALACRWAGGSRVVARGNPFGESVDGIADVLARAGLPVA